MPRGPLLSGSNTSARCKSLLCAICLWTLCTQAISGNTFVYRSADGTTVFSDVRQGSGRARQYKAVADKRVSTARVSCIAKNESRLTDPKTHIQASINRFSAKYNMNPDLIKAVARVESCFDIYAVSTAGAKGLMQLMPETAKQFGIYDLFDVDKNIETGVQYLATLMKKFEYNEKLALAAYNAGPGAVVRHQGIPPYPETRSYVNKVLRKYREYTLSANK